MTAVIVDELLTSRWSPLFLNCTMLIIKHSAVTLHVTIKKYLSIPIAALENQLPISLSVGIYYFITLDNIII